MSQWKSSIAILMGIVILVADVSWLIVGSSYTYLPWLILGGVIFLATLVWVRSGRLYDEGDTKSG